MRSSVREQTDRALHRLPLLREDRAHGRCTDCGSRVNFHGLRFMITLQLRMWRSTPLSHWFLRALRPVFKMSFLFTGSCVFGRSGRSDCWIGHKTVEGIFTNGALEITPKIPRAPDPVAAERKWPWYSSRDLWCRRRLAEHQVRSFRVSLSTLFPSGECQMMSSRGRGEQLPRCSSYAGRY